MLKRIPIQGAIIGLVISPISFNALVESLPQIPRGRYPSFLLGDCRVALCCMLIYRISDPNSKEHSRKCWILTSNTVADMNTYFCRPNAK